MKPSVVLVSVTLLLSIVLSVYGPAANSSAGSDAGGVVGSVWTYEYNETLEDTSMSLSFNGTMRYEYLGIRNMSYVEPGSGYAFYTAIRSNVSGWLYVDNYFQEVTVHAAGTYEVTEYDYYDLESLRLVRTTVDSELHILDASVTWMEETVMYYQETNVTDYSNVVSSPEGMEDQMYSGLLEVGATWTTEYFGTSNVSGVAGTAPYTDSYSIHEIENLSYLGRESVKVDAGRFSCFKVVSEHPGGNVTTWVSPDAGVPAKVESVEGGDQMTVTLLWYDIPGEDPPASSFEWIALGAVVATATVVGVILVGLWIRKGRRGPGSGLEGMG